MMYHETIQALQTEQNGCFMGEEKRKKCILTVLRITGNMENMYAQIFFKISLKRQLHCGYVYIYTFQVDGV